ncbi:glycosyltransferase [Acidimicrobiia bacterium]|nr:glycosyltransferase [Acidimicrobiia bacterium]
MANIKYLIRNDTDVSLIFPLREKESTDNSETLKRFYSIKEEFNIVGTKHNLPFGKVNVLNRVLFLYSHLVWSYFITNKLDKEKPSDEFFFTRSDWVFFFLSRKNRKVVFECHQFTRIRKFLINKSLKKEKSKIIFLNDNLKDDYEKKYRLKNNYIILHNGVDLENYSIESKLKSNEIVFIGKLKRFGESRNVNFLLKALAALAPQYTLKIVGATDLESKNLEKESKHLGVENRVKILKRVSYSDVAKHLSSASIGVLINSNKNTHSISYTSPIKYFEYLAAGLKIIAVDFPSHRSLPFSDNISFFEEGNTKSLIDAIKKTEHTSKLTKDIFSDISLETRTKKIIDFIST